MCKVYETCYYADFGMYNMYNIFYFVTHITCVVLDYEKYDSAMEDLLIGSGGGFLIKKKF